MDTNSKWTEELAQLKAILDKTGLTKVVKWGSDVYAHNGKNVVSAGAFKQHFTLWFYNGVFLKDPKNLLVAAGDKTKSLRQMRFTDKRQIDEKTILAYIEEAVANEEKGLKNKPAKFVAVEIPESLQLALHQNKNLKVAFEKLSPGKQKEYNIYVAEAKQEKTKLDRIEKISSQILAGKGLNDKYKNC
ncbi:MAG: DUF1801 domain-containing protein [Bacteroidota bacterium]